MTDSLFECRPHEYICGCPKSVHLWADHFEGGTFVYDRKKVAARIRAAACKLYGSEAT